MSTLATDDFNRADSATLGANWTVGAGAGESLGILSNQCSVVGAGNRDGAYYSAVAAPNDHYSQAVVVALPTAQLAVMVRSITTGTVRTSYRAGCFPGNFGGGNTQSRIWKEVANVITDLGTGSTTLAAGQIWKLEVVGTSLTFKINGAVEVTVTDADIASGQFGIWAEHNASNFAVFDNWEGGDFAAGAPTTFLLGQGCM